jgi:hypothetical protein
MDFKDQIKDLGKRIEQMKEQVKTEEATKNAFIMPFIQCLGYDVFNPTEVIPEFTADFGIKQGEKVDYAILKDDQPIMLIECKCHLGKLDLHDSQLFRYFSTTKAKFGLLTNGIEFRFYTDLVESNKMDGKHFFVFNICEIKDNQIEELKKFNKAYYNPDTISAAASDLKYMSELRQMLSNEIDSPSSDFVAYFARKIYPAKATQKVVDLFTVLLKRVFTQYINDLITERLKSALNKEESKQNNEGEKKDGLAEDSKIVTTDEERDAYSIIKSILRPYVDVGRIILKDNQTYCAIQLDNTWHQLVRLYFNGSRKYFVIHNKGKKEGRHEINSLDDIYKYADEIKAALDNNGVNSNANFQSSEGN